VDKFVKEVEGQLAERKVKIDLDADARAWLAKKGYPPDLGARPMAPTIQVELKDRIVDDLLFGALAGGGVVRVSVDSEADRLKFDSEGRKAAEPAAREREP